MSVRIIQDGPREFRVVSRWGSVTWPSLSQAAEAAEDLLVTIRLALDRLERDTPPPDPEPEPEPETGEEPEPEQAPEPDPAPEPEPELEPAPVEPAPAPEPAPEVGEKPTTAPPAPAAAPPSTPRRRKPPRPTVHSRYEPCSYQGCPKVGHPMETHWGRGFRFCAEHADAARRVLDNPAHGRSVGPRFKAVS